VTTNPTEWTSRGPGSTPTCETVYLTRRGVVLNLGQLCRATGKRSAKDKANLPWSVTPRGTDHHTRHLDEDGAVGYLVSYYDRHQSREENEK
jgi:hypothetical protein